MNIHSASSRQLYHTRAPARAAAQPRSGWGGAPLLAAAVLFLFSATIGWRGPLVRSVPALAPAFAMAGLPVAVSGPLLRKLTSRFTQRSAGRLLIVEGEIGNPGRRAVDVPGLRVSVQAKDGRELSHWIASAPKSRLSAGETIAFRAKLADPPANAQRVSLRFAR